MRLKDNARNHQSWNYLAILILVLINITNPLLKIVAWCPVLLLVIYFLHIPTNKQIQKKEDFDKMKNLLA